MLSSRTSPCIQSLGSSVILLSCCFVVGAQSGGPAFTDAEKPIVEQMRGLRKLPDDVRPGVTKQLALQIRRLPADSHKAGLAESLANLATEGDPGRDALQEVATTLADALAELPADHSGQPSSGYAELAQLVRYEHVKVNSDNPQFKAAIEALQATDKARAGADFTLADLEGKKWTLSGPRRQSKTVHRRAQIWLSNSLGPGTKGERSIPNRRNPEKFSLRSRRQTGGASHRYAHQTPVPGDVRRSRPEVVAP